VVVVVVVVVSNISPPASLTREQRPRRAARTPADSPMLISFLPRVIPGVSASTTNPVIPFEAG
jgi:hypothetical protein